MPEKLILNYLVDGYYKTIVLPTYDAIYWMQYMRQLGVNCYIS